jgi:hypothetical protein
MEEMVRQIVREEIASLFNELTTRPRASAAKAKRMINARSFKPQAGSITEQVWETMGRRQDEWLTVQDWAAVCNTNGARFLKDGQVGSALSRLKQLGLISCRVGHGGLKSYARFE